MSSKHTWSEELYDIIAKLCVALTNFHIDLHPLRIDDVTRYHQYVNLLSYICTNKYLKRKTNQSSSIERRKRHLEIEPCAVYDEDADTKDTCRNW